MTIITTNTYAETYLLASTSWGSCAEHWSARWTYIL